MARWKLDSSVKNIRELRYESDLKWGDYIKRKAATKQASGE